MTDETTTGAGPEAAAGAAPPGEVPLGQRSALLANLLPFAVLPAEAREAVAALFTEMHYPAGAVVVAQGERGDTLYLIAQGQAEVTLRTPTVPTVMATLGAGAFFGELALLTKGPRTATVTALTPLLLLALTAPAFDAVLETHPLARRIFAASAEALVVATFLKGASPFVTLEAAHIRRLATRFKPHAVAAGSVIVRQGDRWGYACYVLRSGHVEVVQADGSGERCLATLGPGTLFGEAALVWGGPRTATVRALEPCELLVLHRPDLLQALAMDRRVGRQIQDVLRQQDWPRRRSRGVRSRLLARLLGRR